MEKTQIISTFEESETEMIKKYTDSLSITKSHLLEIALKEFLENHPIENVNTKLPSKNDGTWSVGFYADENLEKKIESVLKNNCWTQVTFTDNVLKNILKNVKKMNFINIDKKLINIDKTKIKKITMSNKNKEKLKELSEKTYNSMTRLLTVAFVMYFENYDER